MTRRALALSALMLAAPLSAADSSFDDGKLQPSWFGSGIEFREADEIDYLWVKPGFSLDGKKVRFAPWPEPEFLGEDAGKRDTKDKRLARQMNSTMHEIFAEGFHNAFGSRLEIVDAGEQVRAEGRIVDCSTGSTAAKVLVGFGAGSGNTTIDFKLVDAKSGELLLAIHHRSVSGTTWSTTDSKFVKWVDEMSEEAAEKGFERLYQKAKRVKS